MYRTVFFYLKENAAFQLKPVLCYTHSVNQLKTASCCFMAVILNFLTAIFFYQFLHLPLFLDTIWTVAVVFLFGLVPGLCVSIGYNALNGIVWILKIGAEGRFVFLYSICGILIVISTWLFARRKEEFHISSQVTFLYLFMIVLISSFCTIISSGLIDYFQYINNGISSQVNPIKNFTDSFVQQKFSLLSSCILAQSPISFLDRLIATFSGYGIFRLAQSFFNRRKI